MQTEIAKNAHAETIAAEQRWAAWVARGVKQDARTTARVQIAFPVIVALVVLGMFLFR